MAEFEVSVVKIDSVEDHPNADRLSIVKIGGYNCISAKLEDGSHRYSAGDLVVYIPEAAMLPEWMLKELGFWDEEKQSGTLSGSKGNRVKAIKLRGIVSQGVLYPVKRHDFTEYNNENEIVREWTEYSIDIENPIRDVKPRYVDGKYVKEGEDVAEFLNIKKYEPVIPAQMKGQIKGGLFGYTVPYDIENLQKHPKVFSSTDYVVATEKLHGTLCQIGFSNDFPDDVKDSIFHVRDDIYAYVTSKGLAKKGIFQQSTDENETNLYVEAYKNHIADKADDIIDRFLRLNNLDGFPDKKWQLTIFGEIIGKGVQDLGYGFDKKQLKVFDVHVNIKNEKTGFLSLKNLLNWSYDLKISHAPLLYQGPYDIEKLEEIRDGKTVAGNNAHIREGLVIRCTEEQKHDRLPNNRKQLKFISPDYLLRKNATEYT